MTRADSRTDAEVDALIGGLWPERDRLDGPQVHAVLDAARDPRLIGLLDTTGLERCCLFAGPLSPALRAAAPHLVHLAPDARFTHAFLQMGWRRSWGVLTIAPPDVTLQQLRRHLRTLLRVHDEHGRALLFRFYDPRVLRAYLPICTPTERQAVFGPVHKFICPSHDGNDGSTLVFQRDRPTCLHRGAAPGDARPQALPGLIVHKLQFQSLDRECFYARLIGKIQAAYPTLSASIDRAALTDALERQVPIARGYGLVDEYSLAAFLHAAWLFGNGFDVRIPVVARVLTDPKLRGRVKAKALGDFAVAAFKILERNGGTLRP